MPRAGVSSPGRHVDSASAAPKSTQQTERLLQPPVLTLRFPALTPRTWYRIAALAHERGALAPTKFRVAKFLNEQRVDPFTGRVEGRQGTAEKDGGLTLAERYAYVHRVGEDRFWDDLAGLFRAGFAERVQAPAPRRRAVYALCVRADAIPHDLPEDLARALRVWDLPEAEDPYEDAVYGRLTTRPAPVVEPLVIQDRSERTQEALLTELAAAPRWEHPADSRAAAVAADLRTQWKDASRTPTAPAVDSWPGWEPVGEEVQETALVAAGAPQAAPQPSGPAGGPDLRCVAVAGRTREEQLALTADQLRERLDRLALLPWYADLPYGKASPLYAKGTQRCGFTSAGEWPGSATKRMEKTKRTPSAAPTANAGQGFGETFPQVAMRVMRRVWHLWRRELGARAVLLPQGDPEGPSRSRTGSAWEDLQRTVAIALRRGATESEIVELLSTNVVRRDQWGTVTHRPDDLGRLAGWRLWRLIRSRPDAPQYRRPTLRWRPAEHVTAWDEASSEERERRRTALADERRRQAEREARRLEHVAAERRERRRLRQSWNLAQFEDTDPSTPGGVPPAPVPADVPAPPVHPQAVPEEELSEGARLRASIVRGRATKHLRRRNQ